MTYHLYLGDYSYSSWSLRGWLSFRRFGIPVDIHLVDFNAGSVAEQMAAIRPARTVPTLITPEGSVIWDSLAMAEELATRHPEAGLWPTDPAARACARSLAAEMHSGFGALRSACPMNLRLAYTGVDVADAVLADIQRIEELWTYAREGFGTAGPWLCGAYSVADVAFAPMAMRLAGYDLPMSDTARDYVQAHLTDPALRRWRAMGLVRGDDLARYAQPYARVPWPGPTPLPASATEHGTPENDTCPYSGDPVTHFLAIQGRIFGFCNAFCRDKTIADPEAWPAFMALLAK
ncbi:glutathione S-transferase [Puniceibacterium sp. IMCC21224]|uniref:glutathione S-transferase n=1 Tax=Puniceibacterium sp. IMCC21224 TaxID=1618204 RepID=UPI00064E0DDB|nr:glutathione S-transferase [Puniceibacterium sp. IMCC21224]KMK68613.1 glutathione S-transferase [Puniceibacterium sp. IMCC21224]